MIPWILDAYQWINTYTWIKPIAVLVSSVTVGSLLPLLIFAYERLRLTVRKERLRKKISELDLEGQYLTIFQSAVAVPKGGYKFKSEEQIKAFNVTFERDFNRLYGVGSFKLPLWLTIATSIVFGLIFFGVLGSFPGFDPLPNNGILVLSVAGALLGVFPAYVACYASTSLNANTLLGLLGKVWLSVALGFTFATTFAEPLKLPAAFLGALLPVMTLEALKDTVFAKAILDRLRNQSEDRALNIKQIMEVLDQDEDTLAQLQYLGIRTVRALAYANPLVLYMETDLNFAACVDIVDRAVLFMYVPKPEIRSELWRLGIRTTVDIMTLLYDDYGDGQGMIWLSPGSPDTPPKVAGALEDLKNAMQLPSMDSLYSILDIMRDDPQLRCLFDHWKRVDNAASKSMQRVAEQTKTTEKWDFKAVPRLQPEPIDKTPDMIIDKPLVPHPVVQDPALPI